MYGAMSGVVPGQITSLDANKDFTSDDGLINNSMLELLQLSKVSKDGDSGSPVLMDGKLIGIIVGSDPENSYAIPIANILFYGNLKNL
jgi:hypothetical protein